MAKQKYRPIPSLTEKQLKAFWTKVDKRSPKECWPWTASTFPDGYGNFQSYLAHRIAYFLLTAKDPGEQGVCHTCDNPPCCNGLHLFSGTQVDNMKDMVSKGRKNPALGERNGMNTHPEKRITGDQHWMRQHPELMPRGSDRANAKLTPEQVVEIRKTYVPQSRNKFSSVALAKKFGVSHVVILNVVKGKSYDFQTAKSM